MPSRADQQIELFADLSEVMPPDRPATNRRTIEPPVLPGLPAAPKTAVEDDWDGEDTEIEDAESEEPSDEDTEVKRVDQREKRRYEGFAWYSVAEGATTTAAQPPGVEGRRGVVRQAVTSCDDVT